MGVADCDGGAEAEADGVDVADSDRDSDAEVVGSRHCVWLGVRLADTLAVAVAVAVAVATAVAVVVDVIDGVPDAVGVGVGYGGGPTASDVTATSERTYAAEFDGGSVSVNVSTSEPSTMVAVHSGAASAGDDAHNDSVALMS